MFCIFNPFALSAQYKNRQASADVQNLRRCLGVALHHSIQAFKVKKNHEEAQPISSQKSLLSSKTTQDYEKIQKTELSILKASEEEKKVNNQEEQVQKTISSQNQEKEQKKSKILDKQKKRRLIRKIKKNHPREADKKQEKVWKINRTFTYSEIDFTAQVPSLIGFSSRQIIRKIQQLNKRRVQKWLIIDPLMEKRKRYLKHLE